MAIQYEAIPLKLENVTEIDGYFNLTNPSQWKKVKEDFEFLKEWTKLPNYLKINVSG